MIEIIIKIIKFFIIWEKKGLETENKSYSKYKRYKKNYNIEKVENNEYYNQEKDYKIKNLFSDQELKFYEKLKEYLKEKNVIVLSKVKIADFVDSKNYFNKISQKHIDFIITNTKGEVLLLIELDGESHMGYKTKRSDKFKKELFNFLNIPFLRYNNYSYVNFKKIDNYL